MKRREILKYTAYITGAALSAPLISSILYGCNGDGQSPAHSHRDSIFSQAESDSIKKLVDAIIPKTNTPSASDVGVHTTIESMVSEVYSKEERDGYMSGFEILMRHLGGQTDYLGAIQKLENRELDDLSRAYMRFKQQTVAYYLSTEEIGKNYLNYLPVPGEYKPCITLEEAGGKAWAI